MSEELKLTPGQTLAFFASVIKSGEPWTGTCQKAYDEAMAALRASPTPPTTEGREDIVARLRNDGSSWAQDLFNEAAAEIERLRLLSSPRVEDVRREALEEAAAAVEGMGWSTAEQAFTALEIALLIRSLSPPDGDGKQEQATRASGPTAPTDRL